MEVIYDLLNSVIHNIADSNEKEQSSMLEWMRFSIDVMRTINGSNEVLKDHYQVIFPAEMLLKYLKNEYNLNSNIDKNKIVNIHENIKSILKKDNQYPAETDKTVTFTEAVTFQEPPVFDDVDDKTGNDIKDTNKKVTTTDGNDKEESVNNDKESVNEDSVIDKDEQHEDASFGNITFMDDRGEYFANFFSDI